MTRTAAFLFLAAGKVLFNYPARHTDLRPLPNAVVPAALVLGFSAQDVVVGVPALRDAFDTVPLPLAAWMWAAASVVISWGLAELASRLIWRRRREGAPGGRDTPDSLSRGER